MKKVVNRGDYLHYNLRTGRLGFKVGKLMFLKKSVKVQKHIEIAPKLIVRRTGMKKIADITDKIKVLFYKKSQLTTIKPVADAIKILNAVKRGVLYTTAVATMCFIVYGSFMSLDITIAKNVLINGKSVGTVTNIEQFKDYYSKLHEELQHSLGESEIGKVSYLPCIAFNKSVNDEYTLKQNIMSLYDGVINAYSVYVDNEFVCATLEKADLEMALETIRTSYGNEETATFVQDIEIKNELVTSSNIKFGENIKNELLSSKSIESVYVATKEQSMWEIASMYGMTIDKLEKMNPGIDGAVLDGTHINIIKSVPVLSVQTTAHVEGEFDIAYKSEIVCDKTMAKGKQKITVEGENGKQFVKKDIVFINGEEITETIHEKTIIKEPVTKVTVVGTKLSGIGTGSFIRPTYGSLSSRYGTRWNRQHQGIDISASAGTNIVAADDGVVEFSGWEGGYGNLVKLSHGNGYTTYYGHCSKLLVKKGQIVEKGQVIAKVGSTGRSTGPHLHFEVRLNNIPQNPLEFISSN
ncbi:MAG: peptidoglycan DD-metalloendopeptidase family protein [Clostridia bacterium]|nr:peptidoglycan DD-metalloendopeptidase family protein [Clostridia bacterium]